MKILVLHSRYLSGPVSGENRVVDDEVRLLRKGGHEVSAWTPEPATGRAVDVLRTGIETIHSRRAVQRLLKALRDNRPDVVHFHNLFPSFSPSALTTVSREEVPVAMTLHNYRLMCLPSTLLRDGRPCEDCVGKVPWRGVVHRCYRGSVAGSAALGAALTIQRRGGGFDAVDRYLAVSEFVRNKHIQAGLPSERICVKANFTWPVEPGDERPGRYFLYLGRLTPEKGIDVLLRAWHGVDAPLVVAGEGPQEEALRALAPSSVSFRGRVSPQQASELMRSARVLLVPSLWYEGQPRTILEAYAAGVPVVASAVGALPEVVQQDTSGWLLPPRDQNAWVEAIRRLAIDDAAVAAAGEQARRLWETRFSPGPALEALTSTYAQVIEARRSRSV